MIEQAQKDNGRFEVETDDIRFRKFPERADDTIAEVRYEIRSRADDPLACRVRDAFDASLTEDDVYLHPGAEHWSVGTNGEVTYEGPLAPGRGTSATISIHLDAIDGLESLETEPSIDIARPKAGEGPADHEERASRSDGGEPPASVPIEIDDPTAGGPTTTETPSAARPDGVVDTLIAELQDGNVSSEELEYLRSALGHSNGPADARYNSIRAKVDRLQTDIGDLLAYRDALEEFIDIHGTGDEIIEEVRSGLETVTDRVDTMDDRLDDVETVLSESEDRIDGLQAEIESLATMRERLLTLEDEVASTEEQHADELSALATQLSSIERQLERSTAAIERDVEDMAEELAEARAFRESLGEVMRG